MFAHQRTLMLVCFSSRTVREEDYPMTAIVKFFEQYFSFRRYYYHPAAVPAPTDMDRRLAIIFATSCERVK